MKRNIYNHLITIFLGIFMTVLEALGFWYFGVEHWKLQCLILLVPNILSMYLVDWFVRKILPQWMKKKTAVSKFNS